MALGVDEETAEMDACKMEHDISQKTYEAICQHALNSTPIQPVEPLPTNQKYRRKHKSYLFFCPVWSFFV